MTPYRTYTPAGGKETRQKSAWRMQQNDVEPESSLRVAGPDGEPRTIFMCHLPQYSRPTPRGLTDGTGRQPWTPDTLTHSHSPSWL